MNNSFQFSTNSMKSEILKVDEFNLSLHERRKKFRVDNCGKKKFGWYSSFKKDVWHSCTRCLKITEKVLINIASEVSYVNILSGQKLIKNAKKWSILASFWKPEACGQTVLPDRSVLIGQKLVENVKIQKFQCDILSNFQTMWHRGTTRKL